MKAIERFLSVVAPHSCMVCGAEDVAVCSLCAQQNIQVFGERCVGCNRLSIGSKTCGRCRLPGMPAHVWVAVVYRGVAARLVYKYKFDHQRQLAEFMAAQIVDVLNAVVSTESVNTQFGNNVLVVPVPTATKRTRERGFDHSKLLARQLATSLGLQYADVLGRIGQKSQVGASRHDRISQSKNEYYIKTPRLVSGYKIILVDDVVTTGATLIACSKVLRASGALSVDAAVFAKKI